MTEQNRDADQFRRLWNDLYNSDEPTDIIALLDRVDEQEHSGALESAHAGSLRVASIRVLRDLTADEPERASSILLGRIIALCLVSGDNLHAQHAAGQCRVALAEWLMQYPSHDRAPLRDAVLNSLLASIAEGTNIESACFTIAAIGYRRDDIPPALFAVAEGTTDGVGDVALSTLAALGVVGDERQRIVRLAMQRASRRSIQVFDGPLISVFDRLAETAFLDLVRERLAQHESFGDLTMFAAQVCASIADVHHGDEQIQDAAWNTILALDDSEKRSRLILDINSSIAPACDSRAVVPHLLALWRDLGSGESVAVKGYWLGLRLTECVRPRHLETFPDAAPADLVDSLHRAARADTGYEGRDMTIESRAKELVWDILLRLGDHGLLQQFGPAINRETNSFMRRTICRLLACFRLRTVPRIVRTWVTERFDEEQLQTSFNWAYRTAAIEAVQSWGTREALNDLLACGYTLQDQAPQQTANAAADLAVAFARAGDSTVVPQLLTILANEERSAPRVVAASALDAVTRVVNGLGSETMSAVLLQVLKDEQRPRFEKSLALTILARTNREAIDHELLAAIERWAGEQDDWLAVRALETLAALDGLLHREDLLRGRLGLESGSHGWRRVATDTLSAWSPTIIGELYRQDISAFSAVLAEILRNGNWDAATQAIYQLRITHRSAEGPSVPAVIVDALVARARSRQKSSSGETPLFEALARLAPARVLAEPWEDMLADWLPEVRVALANTLERLELLDESSRQRAETLLLTLARDGHFAVRRAAYRALARQSRRLFTLTYASWPQPSSAEPPVELRQHAAEALAWFPLDESGDQDFQVAHDALIIDTELPVREAAKRAGDDRRRRRWATAYLARVRSVVSGSTSDILAAWRYGQALAVNGDDECLRALEDHQSTPGMPPHVRFWIQTIIDALKEKWKKVTQEWPDPWLPFEGALFGGTGELLLSNGSTTMVSYSVWVQPVAEPPGQELWGGSFIPAPVTIQGKVRLRTEDGVVRDIFIGERRNETALFFGAQRFYVHN